VWRAASAGPTAAGRPRRPISAWPPGSDHFHCYLSMDIEDGYADEPDQVADYVRPASRSTASTSKTAPPRHSSRRSSMRRKCKPSTTFHPACRQRQDRHLLAGQDASVAATLTGPRSTSRRTPTASSSPVPPTPDVLRELTAAITLPVECPCHSRTLADGAGGSGRAEGIDGFAAVTVPRSMLPRRQPSPSLMRPSCPPPTHIPRCRSAWWRYADQKFNG